MTLTLAAVSREKGIPVEEFIQDVKENLKEETHSDVVGFPITIILTILSILIPLFIQWWQNRHKTSSAIVPSASELKEELKGLGFFGRLRLKRQLQKELKSSKIKNQIIDDPNGEAYVPAVLKALVNADDEVIDKVLTKTDFSVI